MSSYDLLLKNPARRTVIPKENRAFLRNVLSENEMRAVLAGLDGTDPIARRDRAIVELLYACDMRTTELCRLRVEDVDVKEQTVTILHAKGGKSRIVPIGQYASYYIGEYLQHARKYFLRYRYTDPGTLFLSRRGNPFNNSSINKAVMRKVERILGSKRYVSCYSMRRAAATHLLEAEVDITYIAKLLGHSSLKSTQRYAQVNIGQLKKMHAKYHPRERNNGK